MLGRLALSASLIATLAWPAFAATWVATDVEGHVVQFDGTSWIALRAGEAVPEGRLLRTAIESNLRLSRGSDRLAVGSGTQLSIADAPGSPLTVVRQDYGRVEIAVSLPQTRFEVGTSLVSAMAAGAAFSVEESGSGSLIAVKSGQVTVADIATGASSVLSSGQMASVDSKGTITVSGVEPYPPILPRQGEWLASGQPRSAGFVPAGDVMETLADGPSGLALRGSYPPGMGETDETGPWTISALAAGAFAQPEGQPVGLMAMLTGLLVAGTFGGLAFGLRIASRRL